MVIEADEEGYTTFQLTVIVNPELERDLMAYGEGIKVLDKRTDIEKLEAAGFDKKTSFRNSK